MTVDKRILPLLRVLSHETRLGLMEFLVQSDQPRAPKELQREVGLAPSSFFKFIEELIALGLVEKVESKYRASDFGHTVVSSLQSLGNGLGPQVEAAILRPVLHTFEQELRMRGYSGPTAEELRRLLRKP